MPPFPCTRRRIPAAKKKVRETVAGTLLSVGRFSRVRAKRKSLPKAEDWLL